MQLPSATRAYGLAAALLLFIAGLAADDLGIPESEFARRRAVLASLLDSSSAAVFRSADARMRSADVNYRYRQESNFLYLTGINQPGCYLIVAPAGVTLGGRKWTGVLSAPQSSSDFTRPSWSAWPDTVLDQRDFAAVFAQCAATAKALYVSAPDLRFVYDWLDDKPIFLERDIRRQFESAHPGLKTKSPGPIMARLRECKSDTEVAQIRRAIECTGEGLRDAMRACKPGRMEYELQAAVESAMIRGGADYPSFPSIIGSGPNSLIPHYDRNRRRMREGEVVVLDVGAEWNGYASDITRTIPVSGRFSPAQKKLYALVLSAQREVIGIIRPGLPSSALDAKAREIIGNAGYGKYLNHGISHQLGLDVHDPSFSDTLRAGMVITVEPGIYIPADEQAVNAEFRGTGIRIEDDVEVTTDGCRVLSDEIPKSIEEIERIMKLPR